MGSNLLRAATCLALFLGQIVSASSGMLPIESRQIVIAVARIDSESSQRIVTSDTKSLAVATLSKTVAELIPNYIQRSFERGLDRRVTVIPILSATPSILVELLKKYGDDLRVIIVPNLAQSSSGIRVTAAYIVPQQDMSPDKWAVAGEENLLLSPDTDYGALDGQLLSFGTRIAERVVGIFLNTPSLNATNASDKPRGLIRLWCVAPLESSDPKLSQVSRILTLELPFYLTEASRERGLELVVQGPDVRDAITNCDPNAGAKQNLRLPEPTSSIETFSWDATLTASKSPQQGFTLVVRSSERDRKFGYQRLPSVDFKEVSQESFKKVADELLQRFLTSQEQRQ
jgi:hypothetical protein